MTAQPVEDLTLETARLEADILALLADRLPTRTISARLDISEYRVHQISVAHGHDRARLRAAAAAARVEVRRLRGDLPAVDVALRLSAAARDLDSGAFRELDARSDRAGLLQLITVFAAMLPPDTDPAQALEWADVDPAAWSAQTVQREADRWRAGARDRIAVTAHGQARAWEQTQV